MLRKKLLTLACALVLVMCGGCFLPPVMVPGPKRPTPPPLRQVWQGIHSVRVVATNVSDAHHLDGEALAITVANRINWMAQGTGIKAFASGQPAREQAVLVLKVEKESATASPATSTQTPNAWSFSIGTSASLTDRNGQVLWQEVEPAVLFQNSFPQDSSIDIWTRRGFNGSLPWFLGERLAHQALYQR
jgi:hypothetical protein